VSTTGTVVETDLLIIGAGPTGLFATYYAGFRGHRVAVVDSLPELGGQITAMYPEKQIFDVAGFPSVKGRSLVDGLVEQAATAKPEYLLDRTAVGLEQEDDGVTVSLDDGTEVRAGAVLITAGIGKFSPRPLPAGDGWVGRGMEFFVPSFEPYAGKDVVIVGGGDSAFDWALNLQGIARTIALVHRRDAFRAHERTVVRPCLGGQYSGQKARNEETEKGRDRCRDRGQHGRGEERDDDRERDAREDRGPTEVGHRALRVDHANVGRVCPKKKPIREAYADRWVRERCQIGINKCDDRSSLSKLTSSSLSWTSLQPSSLLALVNHLLLATYCSLYRHIHVANVNT